MKNNVELKNLLKENSIPYWRLAKVLLVHENTVGRKLREPLTDEDYTLYREAISSLIRE